MPWDGSGSFSTLHDWEADAASGTKIKADRHQANDTDIAQGISNAITRDGQQNVAADIPFGGHRLINVGDAVSPQDAATLKQLGAIRSFATSVTISGNASEGRLTFSGAGTVGFAFTITDLAYGVRAAVVGPPAIPPRWVWNDKADFSGTDVATMNEAGQLALGAAGIPTGGRSNLYAPGEITLNNTLGFNAHFDTVSSRWEHVKSGWAAHWGLDLSTGQVTLMRANATRAAEAAFDPATALVYWTGNNYARFPSRVYASAAYLSTDGNVVGSVWNGYGTGDDDAYTATWKRIEARIDARCITSTRMTGLVERDFAAISGSFYEASGYVVTGLRKMDSDSIAALFRQPQRYITDVGWVVAFPF